MQIVICDDTPAELDHVRDFVANFAAERSIDFSIITFTDVIEMLTFVNESAADRLILLDIDMPAMSGLLAMELLPKNSQVVFISNHDSLVLDATDIAPLGAIRKYHLDKGLPKLLTKFAESAGTKDRSITITENRMPVRLLVDDIVMLESNKNSSIIRCVNETRTTSRSISDYEGVLSKLGFVRTYPKYLLNISYADQIEDNKIILTQEVEGIRSVPLSRRKRKEIQQAINTSKAKNRTLRRG